MCCVEYQVCTTFNSITLTDTINVGGANDGTNAVTINEGWSIDLITTPFLTSTAPDFLGDGGLADGACSGDYVEIPSKAFDKKFYIYGNLIFLQDTTGTSD